MHMYMSGVTVTVAVKVTVIVMAWAMDRSVKRNRSTSGLPVR